MFSGVWKCVCVLVVTPSFIIHRLDRYWSRVGNVLYRVRLFSLNS